MTKWYSFVITALILPSLLIPQIAFSEIKLPKLVSNGAVLQREANNVLWGWAKTGEKVTIKLNHRTLGQTEAKNGIWSFQMKQQPAGGPHTIEISGDNTLLVEDVFFGDVWIASGQSNMQTPMGRIKEKFPLESLKANFPKIRMFIVPGKYDFNTAAIDFDGGKWTAVNKKTIDSLPGVSYFFAKSLHMDTQAPIGIINSSYGGSPAEAWMSEEALKSFPHYLSDIKPFKNKEHLAKVIKQDKEVSNSWYHNLNTSDIGLKTGAEWYNNDIDVSSWKTMEVPNFWEDAGLDPMHGAVWFKKEIELPQSAHNQPANLSLGTIVNADTAYVNGTKVGGITYEYPPRRYTVPKNILKKGKNTITVRIVNNAGKGGFIKDKPYSLNIGKQNYNLSGLWKYKVGATSAAIPNSKFNQYKQPLGRYNAMLAPLLKVSFKGVIWYQGESNTDRPEEYATLFPALIRDWRKQFKQGDFPFIFVQLANFMEAKPRPSESQWAETRDAQLKALKEPNTAMAVTIDVGEWNDIHPLDKKTVGERLALAAKQLVYNNNRTIHSGPLFDSLTVERKQVTLSFKHVGRGLTYRGRKLEGFAVKSATSRYKWAEARIEGDKIIVWNDEIESPISVRYAWADNPDTANLYNKDGLPASPFQADIQ